MLYLTGLKDALERAEDFGIKTLSKERDYGLSLVLGGGEVRLLEMVSAYGVFANDGLKTSLEFISRIEDSNGKIIEQAKPNQISQGQALE